MIRIGAQIVRAVWVLSAIAIAHLTHGCASSRYFGEGEPPQALGSVGFKSFIQSQTRDDVTVSVAVLTATESQAAFGVPLYVFDRPQDIALQKARGSVDERNHLRLWLTPLRYRGMDVYIGQISRDIGIKLSSRTLVTHKIDPEVDEARDYFAQDLLRSGFVAAFGYVAGVGKIEPETPRYNYTKDPYWSDGLRAVFVLSDEPVVLKDIGLLNWE